MAKKKTSVGNGASFSARVRMYNQGLGDCFLLTFPKADGTPFFVLIDCGVIMGTPEAKIRMEAVLADLHETTGGHIDLVVGTHEHWDHLSSFYDRQAQWDTFTFGSVWLGWTEDLDDKAAQAMIDERKKKLAVLAKSAKQLKLRLGATPVVSETEDILSFFGIDLDDAETLPEIPQEGMMLGAAPKQGGKDKIGQAMQYLRDCDATYCRPGEVLRMPEVPGVQVFVLGPPTDPKQMKRDLPRKSEEGTATYHLNAYRRMGRLADPDDDSDVPFDPKYCISEQDAETHPFFAELYFDEDNHWRRIDNSWAGDLPQMALKLDSDTNNTSLALAFRLADGRVLLFPGDAQIGNWESWHADSEGQALTFREDELTVLEGSRPMTAADLLGSVVVYKVGHHGSHNATHKELGLEKMANDFLAFIPCEEFTAHDKKHWTKMPFEPIRKRLAEKNADIVQVDRPLPKRPNLRSSPKTLTAQIDLDGTDAKRPLWYECDVK